MKNFRVTLKYSASSGTCVVSSVIPAYNSEKAINKVIDANNLSGSVVDVRAEEVN